MPKAIEEVQIPATAVIPLQIQAQHINVIIGALNELPRKLSDAIVKDLMRQLELFMNPPPPQEQLPDVPPTSLAGPGEPL